MLDRLIRWLLRTGCTEVEYDEVPGGSHYLYAYPKRSDVRYTAAHQRSEDGSWYLQINVVGETPNKKPTLLPGRPEQNVQS